MNRKKVIQLIVFTLLASAPLLMPAYFMIARSFIRHEMLEKMEKQHLVSLQVPESEFQWYEEGREIIINGKMFDVKSISLSEGVYFIKGLFDDKETELKLALRDQQEEQESKNLYAQQLVQFMTTSAEYNEELHTLSATSISRPIISEYCNSFFPQYIGAIIVPPPDCSLHL